MNRLPLAAAAAFALIGAGAAHAAAPSASHMATSQTHMATSQTQAATANNKGSVVDPDEMKSLNQHNLRAQLRDNLSKSGFTDIKIMPSSFYVQAKNKKGEPVAMVIGPDSFTEVTEVKTAASAQPQASATQSKTKKD